MSSAWGDSWGDAWGNSWGGLVDDQNGISQTEVVPFSFTTAGLHQIVAGVPGVGIRVLSYTLVAAGALTVTFRSSTTPITGAMTMASGRPLKAKARRGCVFQADFGKALNVVMSAAVAVHGSMLVERVSRLA